MLEFLNNLKRKPKHVRSRIAFFSTLGIFFVIVNIWWITWKSPVDDSSVPVSEVATPLGVVANMMMGMKDDAQHVANTLQGQLQYNTLENSETQTANVLATDSSNTAIYPDEVYNQTQVATSSHFQSN